MFQYVYFCATNIVEVVGIKTVRKGWRKSIKNINRGGEETGNKGYQLNLCPSSFKNKNTHDAWV